MPLETDVDYLGDLDPASPGPAEFKSEGDDHFRNLKKAIRQSFPGATGPILVMGTATGPADAYVLTPSRPLVEYKANMLVAFKITAANATTAPTLNISANGAKTIKAVDGGALVAGDLPADSYQFLLYNGTDFVLQAPTKGYIDRVVQALKDYTDQLALAPAFPNQADNAGKVAATDGTNVTWQWAQNMKRLARTSNTMLAQADRAKLIDITSGTFTQTFDTTENLGDGWYALLCNSGTGDITIPASDGVTNWIMYPGEVRLFQCDGTDLRSKVLHGFKKTFLLLGNFIKPPGYQVFEGLLIGGGGSGGAGTGTYSTASGGAGGGAHWFRLPATALTASTPVLVGAGGAARVVSGADSFQAGEAGGASSVAGLVANGGGGGNAVLNGSSASAAVGGTSNNTAIIGTGASSSGVSNLPGSVFNGLPSYLGGGSGAGTWANNTFGTGGASVLSGNGGNSGTTATAGAFPAGGGGAAYALNGSTATSGGGGNGRVEIWGGI